MADRIINRCFQNFIWQDDIGVFHKDHGSFGVILKVSSADGALTSISRNDYYVFFKMVLYSSSSRCPNDRQFPLRERAGFDPGTFRSLPSRYQTKGLDGFHQRRE